MFLEGTAIALAFLAWRKAVSKGNFTPERQECYLAALEHLTDPDKLKKLADSFEKEGLYVQATMLRKRGELRGASELVKAQRKAAFDKGMASTKVEGILALAREFEKITATGAAADLRKHAAEVLKAQESKEEIKEEPKVEEPKVEEPKVEEAKVVSKTSNGHINPRDTDIVVEAEVKENTNG
jgi:hypothetical protein